MPGSDISVFLTCAFLCAVATKYVHIKRIPLVFSVQLSLVLYFVVKQFYRQVLPMLLEYAQYIAAFASTFQKILRVYTMHGQDLGQPCASLNLISLTRCMHAPIFLSCNNGYI